MNDKKTYAAPQITELGSVNTYVQTDVSGHNPVDALNLDCSGGPGDNCTAYAS